MATNIQQNVLELSTTPTAGEPFNFHGILDTILIPRVISADSSLLPGARLLWGVIRQYSCQDGRFMLSDKKLAEAVGVEWRQCIRYCRQLERAGLLRTTPRPGKPPIRELLMHARFAGKLRKAPVREDRGGCPPRQGGLSSKTGPYKEEGIYKVFTGLKKPTIEKVVSGDAPSLPARPRPPVRTDEEIIRRGRECGFPQYVIDRDLERARARRANQEAAPVVTPAYLENESDPAIPR